MMAKRNGSLPASAGAASAKTAATKTSESTAASSSTPETFLKALIPLIWPIS